MPKKKNAPKSMPRQRDPRSDVLVVPDLRLHMAEWLAATGQLEEGANLFQFGILYAGVVIEQQCRILEELSGTSLIALSKEEITTTLRTLQKSLGIADQARSTFDSVRDFYLSRRLGFEPE